MENLKKFDEFVSESAINEGAFSFLNKVQNNAAKAIVKIILSQQDAISHSAMDELLTMISTDFKMKNGYAGLKGYVK